MLSAACLGWVLTLGIAAPPARPTPLRAAYAGFAATGLTPRHQRALEALILEGLDDYESFRLVDAGGQPLDPRLLASEAMRVERLRREGIDLFLNFKAREARQKLELAVEVFENQLTSLPDHELLHATLLALAEAELQSGDDTASRTTLGRWIALGPHKAPRTDDHSKRFVKLYQQARKRKGPTGAITLSCVPADCVLQLDGKTLGPGSQHITKLRAGKHYVVARFPHALERRVVRVARGRNTEIEISLGGPSEAARQGLLDAVTKNLGSAAAREAAAKVAGLARSDRVIVAATLAEAQGKSVVLAVHDKDGDLLQVVKTPLPGAAGPEAATVLARMGVALFVDKKESIALDPDGRATAVPGLGRRLYEGVRGGAVAPTTQLSPQADPVVQAPAIEPDDNTPAWYWFVAGGLAVVAAGTALGVVLAQGDASTTQFEINLP